MFGSQMAAQYHARDLFDKQLGCMDFAEHMIILSPAHLHSIPAFPVKVEGLTRLPTFLGEPTTRVDTGYWGIASITYF